MPKVVPISLLKDRAIQEILTAHSQVKPAYSDIEMEILFDRVHDRYQEKECENFPS
jgi:hypothetical protein